nr:MAG TPA: hypothetical protein [Bacteriophage sp.]
MINEGEKSPSTFKKFIHIGVIKIWHMERKIM